MTEETSNFKTQSSNKLQDSKFKNFCLIFDVSLDFDVWSLNFASEGGPG